MAFLVKRNKGATYKELIKNLLEQHHLLSYRISVKLNYLHSHLDFFKSDLGDVSEECEERYHMNIEAKEKRYQG